jgi:hypothetical protein
MAGLLNLNPSEATMLILLRRFVLMAVGSWALARLVRRYPRLAFAQRILNPRAGRMAVRRWVMLQLSYRYWRRDSMAKRATSGASKMSFEDVKKLAFDAAETTLAKLRHEVRILEATFPELATPKGRAKLSSTAEATAKKWTDTSRKAVASRVQKYQAARKRTK